MTEQDAVLGALNGEVNAVVDAMASAYGGALQLAHVHGWRYRGETTEDNWPVPLKSALDALVLQAYTRGLAAGKVEALEASACGDCNHRAHKVTRRTTRCEEEGCGCVNVERV